MRLTKATFEFEMPNNKVYSAHWSINTGSYSNLKYEVSIFRGGGYKLSYYTDNRICEKNSKEFIDAYLKTLQP